MTVLEKPSLGGETPLADLREEDLKPMWYLNGFPKSGLHWIALMMSPLAQPQFEDHAIWNRPWAGTFQGNSWMLDEVPLERATFKIGRLQDGNFIKGHSAWSQELEQFLWYLGASTIFIYRDFRDVAVSQAFHVISERDDLMSHPNKQLYQRMKTFDDVLMAVIVGVEDQDNGVFFPGVMQRWAGYSNWLGVPWALKIRFEDIVKDAHAIAEIIIQYGLRRTSGVFGIEPQVIEENILIVADIMVQCGNRTDKSPTFRGGRTGDWEKHFTPEIKEAFKLSDINNQLVELGYTNDNNW